MNRFKFLITIALVGFFLFGPAFRNHILAQKSEPTRSYIGNLSTPVMAESNVDLTGCSDKRLAIRFQYEYLKKGYNDDRSKNEFWYSLINQYNASDCFCDAQTRSEVNKKEKNCDEARAGVWYIYQMTVKADPKMAADEERMHKFWNETVRRYNAQGCFCR